MEILVSTNEAANILGISVQGVHYRIKANKLKSLKKDGKTFVYIDQNKTLQPKETEQNAQQINIHNEVVKLKDEHISLLKQTIAWIKKQNKKEISRLQKSHDKVIDAFKSEISLLQKAYNELHKLYQNQSNQIEHKVVKKDFLELYEFIELMSKTGKSKNEIKLLILDRVKIGDKRFMFNSFTKDFKIVNDDFKDII